MSTYPPKLDKARKAWLASLKTGDEVAIIGEGYLRVCRVHVDRSDKKFPYSCTICFLPSGKWEGGDNWIVPVTTEHRAAQRLQDLRERLSRGVWALLPGDVSDEQIEAVAWVLGWDAERTP